jgi:hypothetical protein
LLKVSINDKDNEIVSLRNQYFRLIEGFKLQVKEKQTVIEMLSAEDAKKMKIQLQLRNKIMDAEKTFER